MQIGDHNEQLLCYIAKLDAYTMVLKNGLLQTHNLAINWKNSITKFMSAWYMESEYLLRGILYINYTRPSGIQNYALETTGKLVLD